MPSQGLALPSQGLALPSQELALPSQGLALPQPSLAIIKCTERQTLAKGTGDLNIVKVAKSSKLRHLNICHNLNLAVISTADLPSNPQHFLFPFSTLLTVLGYMF